MCSLAYSAHAQLPPPPASVAYTTRCHIWHRSHRRGIPSCQLPLDLRGDLRARSGLSDSFTRPWASFTWGVHLRAVKIMTNQLAREANDSQRVLVVCFALRYRVQSTPHPFRLLPSRAMQNPTNSYCSSKTTCGRIYKRVITGVLCALRIVNYYSAWRVNGASTCPLSESPGTTYP